MARERRYRLREVAGAILGGRVARCGTRPLGGQVVLLKSAEGGNFYRGIETCGSVWLCPVCAAKVAEGRRCEVEATLDGHLAAGGVVYIAAFTIPHHAFQRCRELRQVVSNCWRKVQAGEPWKRAARRVGLLGLIRSHEVTVGGNGWHPHLHVLFFFDGSVGKAEIVAFGFYLFERWARFVEREGYGKCSPEAWSFERVKSPRKAGDYVVKWGCDSELTKSHLKVSRKGGRTPWQLLGDARGGDQRAADLFEEYAYAFKGARQLTWSKGLRERYGVQPKVSDEDLAADEAAPAEVVGVFDAATFREIIAKRLAAAVLTAAERGGWGEVLALLDRNGVRVDDGERAYSGRAGPGDRGAGPGVDLRQAGAGARCDQGRAAASGFDPATGEIIGGQAA